MRAIDGCVSRLERTYGVRRVAESEEAVLRRRLDDVIGSVPTEDLRLLLEAARAGHPATWLSAEHRAAEERLAMLLDGGATPP